MLHSADWGGQDTLHVTNQSGELCAMTGTIDVLKAIAEAGGRRARSLRSAMPAGARDSSTRRSFRHGWFAAAGDAESLFEIRTNERWAAALKSEGVDTRLLASETGAA